MQTRVIVNMRSGGARRHVRELPMRLAHHGIVADVTTAADHDELETYVRRYAKQGADAIIVGGGDGSMTAAANALAYGDTVLGVLPLGTGNSFAKTLGIPTKLDDALAVVAGGHVRAVDLGVVNDRYFANFATIGLSAEIAKATPHVLKPLLGPLAYAVAGVLPFLRARGFRARVRSPEGKLRVRTAQMVIASGRYFGQQPVLPDASITDGELAFFATEGTSHVAIAVTYLAYALGLHTRLPNARTLVAPRLTVKTKGKEPISVDGASAGKTPAHFRVAPRALRVYVPPAFAFAPQ